jgi:predicted small lipoprotein YifL
MTRPPVRSSLAIGSILCVMLAACGHYGPPVHPEPARDAAAAPAPASSDAPEPANDTDREHHEP